MLLQKSSLLLLIIFLVAACNKYKAGDVIDNNDVVPPSPSILSYFTVEGADDDLDGVRDDIEIWINEEFDDPNIRMALKQEARAWYKKMFVTSPEENLRIIEDLRQAVSCFTGVSLYKNFELSKREYNKFLDSRRMLSRFENNYWRKKWFDAKNKYSVSGSYRGGEMNIMKCLNYCRFEVQNLKRLLQIYYDTGRYKAHSSEEDIEEYIRLLKETK